MKKLTAPFEKGQQVTTGFYPIEKDLIRTVTRCYQSNSCESGWLMDTVTEKGKELQAIDSNWYQLSGEKNNDAGND